MGGTTAMARRRDAWLGAMGPAMVALLVLAALVGTGGRAAAQGDDETGVDDNQYESPTYGYVIEWDEDVWEVGDEVVDDDGYDALQLASDLGFLFLEGYEGDDGDPELCLAAAEEDLADHDGVDDVSTSRSLDPPPGRDVDESAVFTYEQTDEDDETLELAEYVECHALTDDAVLRVTLQTLEDDYEDAAADAADVLDTLELPEAEDGDDGADGGGDDGQTDETIEIEIVAVVVDEATGDPLEDAIMVVLEPGLTVDDFDFVAYFDGDETGIIGEGRSDEDGAISFEVEIEVNDEYTVLLFHEEYQNYIYWEDLVLADSPTIESGDFGEVEL
jgi:hypothetical protein